MAIASINPSNGETLRTFEPFAEAEIESRLQRAAGAFRSYRRAPFAQRAAWLMLAAEILEQESEEFARLMSVEMGKLIQAGRDEAAKCARACRYYADNGERFLADVEVRTGARRSFVHYQPLGAVLAIMPWNFPFWQVIRFAAPGLMAGNVALLKHASNVPQCALAIEDLFRRAGFPDGVFQTLLIGSDQVEPVLEDRRVAAVTLTGSTRAGSQVASQAGRLIKKSVLELGGSDPFIVMPGAPLEETVKSAVSARMVNTGQSCIAAKRFIVHERVYDEFAERFCRAMAALHPGDPLDRATQVGPLATAAILDDLEEQVQKSVEMGARVLTGGRRLEGPGFYYAPTVLAEIPPGSPAQVDEIFGPVAALFRVRDLDEALRVANDTPFGLGAGIWTNEPAEQAHFVDEIEAGMAFVNAIVASDPRLPFGGVKGSGFGRELGELGIREFTNAKSVSIDSWGLLPQNE